MSFKKFGSGDELGDLSRHILQMMDQMVQRRYVEFRDVGSWQPATNVYESNDAYVVCVELAGVNQEQIDIHVDEQRRLIICGRRTQPQCLKIMAELRVHMMEIAEGPFSRQIEMPYAVDVSRIEATYERGFLWICVPKLGHAGEESHHGRP